MDERGRTPGTRARELWGTVRVRTTAAAVAVVAVALVVSGVAMVVLLRRSLTADVERAALLKAEAVADELASPDADDAIPVDNEEEEFVQVFDAGGRVVASSANVAGERAIVMPAPGETRRVEGLPFEDDPFLAVATSVSGRAGSEVRAVSEGGSLRIVVGRTLEFVTESGNTVVRLLSVGIPLLLALLGAVIWRVVGRALAPVEALRTGVEAISTRELHRRVPDPPGNDEIARLATTMNRMLSRLEDGQARQRRFVSDASHELRSPVATIRQHAEVALSHPEGTSLRDLAEVVLAEDVRLQSLVEDLLLLSAIDEGTLRFATDVVDLDDIVFEEADRLRRSTQPRVDTTGVSAGRVSGDRRRLVKLVRNLADNAARHARATLALSLSDDAGEVVLSVDDDGDGIPAPDRERVFERFVRLDEARDRDSGGSGLGLAIVAEIAAGHGARVAVLEGPLGGARVEVRFPAPHAEPSPG